jgi:hypothetical protein
MSTRPRTWRVTVRLKQKRLLRQSSTLNWRLNSYSKLSSYWPSTTLYELLRSSREKIRKGLLTGSIRYVVQVAGHSLLLHIYTAFVKAYPSVNTQNVASLLLFGEFCSAIGQLPTSAMLSPGLVKRCDTTVASGEMMSVWQGEDQGAQVSIRSLRACSGPALQEAKKVRIERASDTSLSTRSTDSVENGAHVEKDYTSRHCRVSGCERGHLQTRTRL